jgi:hypothetical protein
MGTVSVDLKYVCYDSPPAGLAIVNAEYSCANCPNNDSGKPVAGMLILLGITCTVTCKYRTRNYWFSICIIQLKRNTGVSCLENNVGVITVLCRR